MRQIHVRVDQYVFAAIICVLIQQLQSCDWARRTWRFVRLVLKVFVQNYGDFIDKTMLYLPTRVNGISSQKTVMSLKFLCCRWCIGRRLPKQIFWIPRLWAEIWRMHIKVSSENKIWAAFTKREAYCVRNTADYGQYIWSGTTAEDTEGCSKEGDIWQTELYRAAAVTSYTGNERQDSTDGWRCGAKGELFQGTSVTCAEGTQWFVHIVLMNPYILYQISVYNGYCTATN